MELNLSKMLKLKPFYCKTNGNGLWSRKTTTVKIYKLAFDEGELRAYFTKKTWDTDRDGLIYTDPEFIRQVRRAFKKNKFNLNVDYTEQGMQGDNYVSLSFW